MKAQLPAHIAFSQHVSQAAGSGIKFNLSQSAANSLKVHQLLALASTEQQAAIEQLLLTYASIQGDVELRQLIADFHTELNAPYLVNWPILADQVLTFAGAQEGLKAIYQQLLNPDDEVIVITPSYPSLVTMAEQFGARVKCYPLDFANAWQLDIEVFEGLFSDKTKLVVINSPHNPTGTVLSAEQIERILALVKKHNSYLLMDDVSQASNYQVGDKKLTLAHGVLNYQKGIVASVMSKSLGLAGIRIGWLITRNTELLTALLVEKCAGSICTSILDEQLAIIALQNRRQILRNNNQLIADNIKLFQQLVDELPELLSWQEPQAGIITLVKVSDELVASRGGMRAWALDCAKQTGVLVLPSDLFGLEGNHFRLGLGQQNFAKALALFKSYFTLRSA